VRILRKIEREPTEAPQTSAAIRALERARRNRGKSLLEQSRAEFKEQKRKQREATLEQKRAKAELAEANAKSAVLQSITNELPEQNGVPLLDANQNTKPRKKSNEADSPFANRKPITEVLHDIYDGK
jgi:uncharacterized surface protein with fasciclin (FAS1) repeats